MKNWISLPHEKSRQALYWNTVAQGLLSKGKCLFWTWKTEVQFSWKKLLYSMKTPGNWVFPWLWSVLATSWKFVYMENTSYFPLKIFISMQHLSSCHQEMLLFPQNHHWHMPSILCLTLPQFTAPWNLSVASLKPSPFWSCKGFYVLWISIVYGWLLNIFPLWTQIVYLSGSRQVYEFWRNPVGLLFFSCLHLLFKKPGSSPKPGICMSRSLRVVQLQIVCLEL